MARSGRPASESYQSACCSVGQSLSSSSEVGTLEDEDDRTPIFSLSKSSVDVVTATGPPHKRDLAWMRLDLKRSSSTNTHSEQNQVTLQQLHHHKWHHNSHQFSVTTQNEDLHSPPPLSERWISNMHRWSGCSSSTHSRSSTPDTVVGKEGSSRSCRLSQEATGCFTPDSPMSRVTSPPTTPSPLLSPFHTPTLPPQDHLASSPLTPSTHRESVYSPLPRRTCRANSSSPEKLLFQFPSPVQSHASLTDEGQCADSSCLVNDESKESPSPTDTQVMEDKGEESPLPADCKPEPSPSAEKTDFKVKLSGCHYLLSLEQSCQTGKSWRTPLVSSLSDSRLGDLMMHLEATANNLKSELLREEGTMTSQLEMMDAAVQTGSPLGSCCDFQKNMSNSNSGSHSLLGSPPGSRLNLKASVGSHSNLVSASSSMFPVSSGEEEDEEEKKQRNTPEWDGTAPSALYLERKRSCLKAQSEDCDELGRRGSMKQVLWDEDGLTWDIHGASLDPEELSTAIQKHLDLKNSPQPQRRSSKKKKAPLPPLISNMVTTMAPDTSPPAMSIKCMVEGESEETLETEAASEVQPETGGRKQEKEEANCSRSREEQGKIQEIEEEEGGEKTANSVKSPTQGSGHSKKKIVIRSLRRPGWCGGSKKTDD